MFTQADMLEKCLPILKTEGAVFQKNKNVYARRSQAGEVVHTHTADGLETINRADEGDFIVRNQTAAAEEYIVPAHKFLKNYTHIGQAEANWEEYAANGRIVALELTPGRMQTLGFPDAFEFLAPWGSPMAAKAGDFLCCPPDFSEVYRIARQEFFETYKPV